MHATLVDNDRIVGDSPFARQLRSYIGRLAPLETNVLITGETGTGKELVASLLHKNSRRRDRPLVCINCAAIPDELIESELFGYERGAFTGAYAMKEGKLTLANGGTVFLDEVGDMSLCAQAKLLRVLESRQVERLGGCSSVGLNVRVISATNQNLEEMVSLGRFRMDLYFRLNVARIQLPPLRERRTDIGPLIRRFTSEFHALYGRELLVQPEVLHAAEQYDWPGNVRELRNFVESLYATTAGTRVSLADLPEPFHTQVCCRKSAYRAHTDERAILETALSSNNWNKTKTARELGWSRMTIYRKLAKYRIKPAPSRRSAAFRIKPLVPAV